MVAWDTYRRLVAMLLIVASCLLVSSLFRVYAKLKYKNGRRVTSGCRLPIAVNVMLNLFNIIAVFFFSYFIQLCDRDSCDIGFRVQFNAEFPRQAMNFPI